MSKGGLDKFFILSQAIYSWISTKFCILYCEGWQQCSRLWSYDLLFNFRNVSTWNQQTLVDLGILPLYFTKNIWGQFKTVCIQLVCSFLEQMSPVIFILTNKLFHFVSQLMNKNKVPVTYVFPLVQTTKKGFLKGFMPGLRKGKTQKRKLKKLFKQISASVAKRAAGECLLYWTI